MASARVEELRKRLEKEPASRLFAQLAEELRKDGQLLEAIRVSREGLGRHANYPSARMTLARCLLESGDPGGARRELEQVVAAAPDNILAQRLLGESCEALGELEAAVQAYQGAAKFSPGDPALVAKVQEVERRAAEAAARARPMASIGDMENRFAPQDEEESEAAPISLTAGEEEFEIERGGEALAATLPPAGRSAGSLSRPPAAEPAQGPADEMVFEFESGSGGTAVAGSFEPVFRPLEASETSARVEGAASEGLEVTRAPSAAVPAFPAPFESALPATVPGTPLEEVAGASLASPTLAELYFGQGAYDRAIQTYEEVLRREPGNDGARRRLAEIGALLAEQALAAESQTPGDRRALLIRTIARLEALLAAVGRA